MLTALVNWWERPNNERRLRALRVREGALLHGIQRIETELHEGSRSSHQFTAASRLAAVRSEIASIEARLH